MLQEKVLKNSRIDNSLSKDGRFFDRMGTSSASSSNYDVNVVMESSSLRKEYNVMAKRLVMVQIKILKLMLEKYRYVVLNRKLEMH